MLKLAIVPLFLLIFACIFGIAYNYSVEADRVGDFLDSGSVGNVDNSTLYQDGSGTELGFDSTANTISFSLSGMMIVIFGLALALGAVVGIQVLGSGLSQFSVKSIVVISVMMSIWGIFSTFGYNVFATVPVFGQIIYFVLTLAYSFGVFSEIWA